MSAKDDLAFVEFHREQACTNGMSSCSYSAFVRLLALAERGARFTKEHEDVIREAVAYRNQRSKPDMRRVGSPSFRLIVAVDALNEASEKENER